MDHYKYILISGTGRSGTTIIKDILSQHPQIGFVKGRETRIFSDPPTVFDLKEDLSPYYQDKLIKELKKKYTCLYRGNIFDKAYGKIYREKFANKLNLYLARKYQGIALKYYYPEMMSDLSQFFSDIGLVDFRGTYIGSKFLERTKMYFYESDAVMINAALKSYVESVIQKVSQGSNCIIEDNPFGFYYLDDFKTLLGEGFNPYFILRDPRDIVASSMNTSWAPKDFQQCCSYIRKILSDFEKYESQLTLLKLEDFIDKPEKWLNSIIEKSQLEPFEFSTDAINAQSVGRFKKLGQSKVKYLNDFFSRELEKYGYSVD